MSNTKKGPAGVHVQRGNQQRRVKVVGRDGELKGEVAHYVIVEALLEREGIATSLTPEAQVEAELKAISVCEECRERPLSMTARAIEKRRHKERPWRCGRCATIENNRAKVATQAAREAFAAKVRESRKKAWEGMSPEERERVQAKMADAQRARRAKLTDEERARVADERSSKMKALYAKKTSEEMVELSRRARGAQTLESKRRMAEASRARWAAMTAEERSEQARLREARRTPEQRSETARARAKKRYGSEGK